MGKEWTIEEKGVGGFVELEADGFLLLSWWALKEKLLRKLDFRALWGCLELVTRHTDGKPATYTLEELGRIVSCKSRGDLRDAVTRLCRLGFLAWSDTTVHVTTDIAHLNHPALTTQGSDLPAKLHRYRMCISQIHRTRRQVKIRVPRRVVRFIAGGAKTSLIAHLLACCITCLFVDKQTNELRSRGKCRLDWIQTVFGGCLRSLRDARKELLRMDWLRDLDGDWLTVNLTWAGPPTETQGPADLSQNTTPLAFSPDKISYLAPQIPDKFSAPSIYINQHPLQELRKNQHPASSGSVDGAYQRKREDQGTRRFWVEDGDLANIERLMVLFTIAQELGWVGHGEMEFLEFVALAQRARSYGTQSPGGMFYRLVRNRNYRGFITQEQEERARRGISEYRDGQRPPAKRSHHPGPVLSRDAKTVQVITEQLLRAGFAEDIFTEVHRQCPEWTRERWDTATCELERFHLAQKQQGLGLRVTDVSVVQAYLIDEAA